MTKDEALKMAIEALAKCKEAYLAGPNWQKVGYDILDKSQQACKEASEQPTQEPVAWIKDWADGSREIVPDNYDNSYPVYTHPAPLQNKSAESWQGNKEFVGLSDDEIDKIWLELFKNKHKPAHLEFAKKIIDTLENKNAL